MPEKPLTIATYAAGASLAAITLVYVFGPTFFIDGEAAGANSSSRKRYAVGLINTANDCFINSALQALAGLADLRLYLIRETHRRKLDGADLYAQIVQDATVRGMSAAKIEGLQRGIVTFGMKDMLDGLNERPITKKNISPQPFIASMEAGYKTRISRQQQDAHEFLVLVAERMCDEYHAGHRARKHARSLGGTMNGEQVLDASSVDERLRKVAGNADEKAESASSESEPLAKSINEDTARNKNPSKNSTLYDEEDGFPLEGAWESQIECQTCGFKPQTTESTFAILTLSVPQVSSTSLNSCFDDVFKTEVIDEFKCEKCRLVHALTYFKGELTKATSEEVKDKYEHAIERVQTALNTNPEAELHDVELPDTRYAPKRRIKKHNRITRFPKVLAIHLSRSIFDAGSATMKNSAKISFEERLTLGGLLSRRVYRLSSVICHKGNHGSGHYESFRRQTFMSPFSTPNVFAPTGVYSKQVTPQPSQISTPQIRALKKDEESITETSTLSSTPELLSPASVSSSSVSVINSNSGEATISATASNSSKATARASPLSPTKDSDTNSMRSMARSARSKMSRSNDAGPSTPTRARAAMNDIVRGKRKSTNKWWRISDSKVKECKTSDLLGMQKEVYILFYELEKSEEDSR